MTSSKNTSNGREKVAVVYTHFPHYREAVFEEMARNKDYSFSFFYDPRGITETIESGAMRTGHFAIKTVRLGPILIQLNAVKLAMVGNYESYIFLGNPYIVSTWLAAIIARLRGRGAVVDQNDGHHR